MSDVIVSDVEREELRVAKARRDGERRGASDLAKKVWLLLNENTPDNEALQRITKLVSPIIKGELK